MVEAMAWVVYYRLLEAVTSFGLIFFLSGESSEKSEPM